MAFEEGTLIDQLNASQAQNGTLRQNNDTLKDQIRSMRETFGIKGDMSGYSIDFARLVNGITAEQAADLRAMLSDASPEKIDPLDPGFVTGLGLSTAFKLRARIDEEYMISGGPGEKPKIRIRA